MKNIFITLILTFIMAACAPIEGRETAGEYLDDAAITTKVKAAIVKEPSLSAVDLSVETFQNVVQLSGFVDSAQKAARAEQLARKVKGVKAVENSIIVKK